MVVCKYQLNILEATTIYLPQNHKVVYCESIDNKAFIWVEQENFDKLNPFRFEVFATGQEFDLNPTHCGTFITKFGFVGHVYAMGEY